MFGRAQSHRWDPLLQKLVLTAKRDIALGEELYTTYGGYEFTDTTAQRRAHLMTEFGFHCMCQLCVQSDRAEAPGGDGLTQRGWQNPRTNAEEGNTATTSQEWPTTIASKFGQHMHSSRDGNEDLAH